MLVCQFVWATKTIALGTCLVVDTCFMISASRPGKQVVRANRVMKSAHSAESPSGSSSLSISRGGRSHARILRPSSSHKLDIILIALELPVSIYFEAVIQLRVRRFHSNPPHLFTFYLTHAHFVLFNVFIEKSCRSSVILKIVGATLQLDQNINPQDICPDNFSFVYKYIWV